jgi:hypothetical protein
VAFVEDLDAFTADLDSVEVSWDGSEPNLRGYVDAPGLFILADQGRAPVNATDRTLLIRSDRLDTLNQGDTITVDAVPYLVREIQPVEDGAFSLVSLR